ncbi:hypothetical protein CH267_02015 [Rhodococcus sp. 06-621-2]|nr:MULTISPECIES: hypothetical protein [unclassified Rhodococcus (in: high G+C Gram-positive bacteria)]OZC62334.1 hypothetical protein CH267_02015 [Rhodococcus sp. 06-621-2]
MRNWGRRDSERLDRAIIKHYPNRSPLQRDPHLAALLAEDNAFDDTRVGRCADCQRLIWRSDKPKPVGILHHFARGLCCACYKHHTRGTKRRAPRVEQQATA